MKLLTNATFGDEKLHQKESKDTQQSRGFIRTRNYPKSASIVSVLDLSHSELEIQDSLVIIVGSVELKIIFIIRNSLFE